MNSDLGDVLPPPTTEIRWPAWQIALALAIVLLVANLSRTIVDRPADQREQRSSTGRPSAPSLALAP